MRTGVELTRSQKEKEQREESKADESPPPDAHPKPPERRPVLALALGLVEGLLPRRAQAAPPPAQLLGSRLRRDDRRPRRPDPALTQRRVLDGPRVLARGRVRRP